MFSQICDTVIEVSGRRDHLAHVVNYVNLTVRELNTLADFNFDSVEGQILATSDAHVWDLPHDFARIRSVRYRPNCYPPFKMPGRHIKGLCEYVYQSGNSLVFVGAKDKTVDYMYYRLSPKYKYIEQEKRNAFYCIQTCTWKFIDANDNIATSLGSNALDEAAKATAGDYWILIRWHEQIITGALAKLYTLLEDSRAAKTYALFKDIKKDLKRVETDNALTNL